MDQDQLLNRLARVRTIVSVFTNRSKRSRRGVGDKPVSCKPGVAGSIPGFSIKPLSVEPSGVSVRK